MHKPLNDAELEIVSGYLESVKNLATCAEVLIRHNHCSLLYTILEEMAVNTQHIIDEFCTIED
jgi:hypothetical protein